MAVPALRFAGWLIRPAACAGVILYGCVLMDGLAVINLRRAVCASIERPAGGGRQAMNAGRSRFV